MFINSGVGDLLLWISALAFIFYGVSCFVFSLLEQEFKRYGLASQRTLVGALQVLGAFALIIGRYVSGFSFLAILGAGGLTLMMLVAIAVRIKIGDSFVQSIPAIVLFLLNGFVLILLLEI